MAEERSLELAPQLERADEEASKVELQRRMDEARDSISQTVTEIKDTVVHQYESVKETISESLDWREQFKKRPAAWSAGALGGGFLVGYGLAAIVKGNSSTSNGKHGNYLPPDIPQPDELQFAASRVTQRTQSENRKSGPGFLERLQQTEAFGHVQQEAASVGSKFVGELSQKIQEVVFPAAISWVTQWLVKVVPETKSVTGNGNSDQAPITN